MSPRGYEGRQILTVLRTTKSRDPEIPCLLNRPDQLCDTTCCAATIDRCMDRLIQQLTPDTTLITANQRQAAQFRSLHDQHQRVTGRVWESLDVLHWEAWVQRLWTESVLLDKSAPLLLAPLQERLLWERVITESQFGATLLQPAAAARRVQEAWQLLLAYEHSIPSANAVSGDELQAFIGWAQQFEQQCRREGWLDRASLIPWLLGNRQVFQSPAPLTLVGFDELTPIQCRLLESARQHGCVVTEVDMPPSAADARRIACRDQSDELIHAAAWARAILEREPDARVAIVVPDLAAQRERVSRILARCLAPAALLPGQDTIPPFNLSMGRALSDIAVVADALLLLELGVERDGLDTERIGRLLRSPYLPGAEQEAGARARLDARLRQIGEPRYRVSTLLFHARNERHACPQLVTSLENWRSRRRELSSRQSAAVWSTQLAALLRVAGWPQGRTLESSEYQAVEAWRGVLGQLATLDEMGVQLNYRQAVTRLRQVAGETLFQPRSADAPIQVLGLLEAAGLGFDYLWVTGLHDEVWPATPRPNPFLPIQLQRRLGMPHSSAERELQFARRITRRLLTGAPRVVVSWPSRDADRGLRPSPLIATLPVIEATELAPDAAPSYHLLLQQSAKWETVLDVAAPELPFGVTVRGGASLLKEQALCPFRAYARFRLGAEPLGTPHPGLDPATRGSLLHTALEALWAGIGNSDTLSRLDDVSLRARAADAVAQAVERQARLRVTTFSTDFTLLEQERLTDLLVEWLSVEAQRAPFAVIAPELEQSVELGGLRLQVRIDRIDQLTDGRRIIIDYKSGETAVSRWFGDRPDEPQLPLYAITGQAPPAALAFAEVRPGQMRFRGLASEEHLLPQVGVRSRSIEAGWSWETLLAEWRDTLTSLAEAFRAGDARVDPKRGAQTCRYCELTSLCRVVTGVEAQADEEDDGNE